MPDATEAQPGAVTEPKSESALGHKEAQSSSLQFSGPEGDRVLLCGRTWMALDSGLSSRPRVLALTRQGPGPRAGWDRNSLRSRTTTPVKSRLSVYGHGDQGQAWPNARSLRTGFL